MCGVVNRGLVKRHVKRNQNGGGEQTPRLLDPMVQKGLYISYTRGSNAIQEELFLRIFLRCRPVLLSDNPATKVEPCRFCAAPIFRIFETEVAGDIPSYNSSYGSGTSLTKIYHVGFSRTA